MNNKYDVIIIGAGIGGLTAGNILAKNGMKVLVLEKNHVAGGAVSTFYRNNYPIDISHAVCALRPGAIINRMFNYLKLTEKIEAIELQKSFIYITNNDVPVFCYADIDKYKEELNQRFFSEAEKISLFFKKTENIWSNEIVGGYHDPSLLRLLTYPFLFRNLLIYRNYTFNEYLDRFKLSNHLKEVISVGWPYLGLDRDKVSALYMICLIGSYHTDKSYFIRGGIGSISNILVSNFKGLGGEIIYNTEIAKILIKDKDTAFAVEDKKKNIYSAKRIISNIDAKKTYLELIGKDLIPHSLLKRVNKFSMSCSMIQIHIAAKAEVASEYLSSGTIMIPFNINLEERISIFSNPTNARKHAQVAILGINHLKDFLPENKEKSFIFNIGILSENYALWNNFRITSGENEYEKVKYEIGQLTLEELKKFWKIKDVKFIHVLTPLSFEGWLGATEGAVYDFACLPNQVFFSRLKVKSKINNLYHVGAKAFPGHGIIGALISSFSLSDLLLNNSLTKGKLLP